MCEVEPFRDLQADVFTCQMRVAATICAWNAMLDARVKAVPLLEAAIHRDPVGYVLPAVSIDHAVSGHVQRIGCLVTHQAVASRSGRGLEPAARDRAGKRGTVGNDRERAQRKAAHVAESAASAPLAPKHRLTSKPKPTT